MSTHFLEEHIFSFFRVEEVATCYLLVSFLVYCSSLNMEAMIASEASVKFHRTTRPYNPEDIITLHSHPCENIKSINFILLFTLDVKLAVHSKLFPVDLKTQIFSILWQFCGIDCRIVGCRRLRNYTVSYGIRPQSQFPLPCELLFSYGIENLHR
jgi:hypothetical protein